VIKIDTLSFQKSHYLIVVAHYVIKEVLRLGGSSHLASHCKLTSRDYLIVIGIIFLVQNFLKRDADGSIQTIWMVSRFVD